VCVSEGKNARAEESLESASYNNSIHLSLVASPVPPLIPSDFAVRCAVCADPCLAPVDTLGNVGVTGVLDLRSMGR